MLEEIASENDVAQSAASGPVYLCLHGHFYQPPRENPFTNQIPTEAAAAPFANFNEKITAECYAPNAAAGNFDLLSFDLGPTLATWLEQAHPDVYQRVIEADHRHVARYGVGNAMAQAYNHTILPLATTRDKRTQILWGLSDFRHRYGREATGMWLAETATDLETLDIMAQLGIRYTVLAPWQAASEIDPAEPYRVRLFDGRSITVFFYNAPLSGGVSFNGDATSNADRFASSYLVDHLEQEKREEGHPQLILIATDGELYGHHQPWRDKFLAHLMRVGAPAHGFEIRTLEHYLEIHPVTHETELNLPSSWSCHHGVARWDSGCDCTEGDHAWKGYLRQALNNLAARGDRLFAEQTAATLVDPWAARDAYLPVRNGWEPVESFWQQYGKNGVSFTSEVGQRTLQLLEAQYYQQCSFTSCGFFFEDLDRIEPRNDIGFARRAISLYWLATGIDLQLAFLRDLQVARSWKSSLRGDEIYRLLPPVDKQLLPAL